MDRSPKSLDFGSCFTDKSFTNASISQSFRLHERLSSPWNSRRVQLLKITNLVLISRVY